MIKETTPNAIQLKPVDFDAIEADTRAHLGLPPRASLAQVHLSLTDDGGRLDSVTRNLAGMFTNPEEFGLSR